MQSLVFLCIAFFCLIAQGQDCGIEEKGPQEAIHFLQIAKNDSSVDPACITVAIRQLERIQSQESIHILVEYLDFRRPPRDEEKVGLSLRVPTIPELYPAVSVLFSSGKTALPALARVIGIGSPTYSALSQKHAMVAVMLIYRDEPVQGIKFLLEAASKEKEKDPDASARLRQSASDALHWCGQNVRAECEAVLND